MNTTKNSFLDLVFSTYTSRFLMVMVAELFLLFILFAKISGNSLAVTVIGNSVDSFYSGNGSPSMSHERVD